MAVQLTTQNFQLSKGIAEGVSLKWDCFSLLIITAPKGFLACCIFDLEVIGGFGIPAAIVESAPGNPIGTLERMMTRHISKVNKQGETLGIKTGMTTEEALEKLF